MGRSFLAEEERPGKGPVAIISNNLWRQRFGADPGVLGKSITLNGTVLTVVGVMPPGFQHPCPWSIGERTDVWIPLTLTGPESDGRDSHQYLALGRLKRGTSPQRAAEEMNAIARRLSDRYPDTNADYGVSLTPLHEELVGNVSPQLMMLLGASGLVLLLVCGNVAGLLLARTATRRPEFAVRSALGAGRLRVMRQVLAENLPLSLLGGGLGILLAAWGVTVLRVILPSDTPRTQEIGIDAWVLVFTLCITMLTAILFSLVPVIVLSGRNLICALKEGGLRQGVAPNRARSFLVVAQFALTLVLANAAALMLQSYWKLWTMDHGFSTDNVLTMSLSLQGPKYEKQDQRRAFFENVRDRLEGLPGIRHAAAISRLPLEGGTNTSVVIEGEVPDGDRSNDPLVEVRVITPNYNQAMGIPLLAGRSLDDQDSSSGRPGVLINQAMARRFWPGEDPIGKRFAFKPPDWRTVVGVVGDVRQWGLESGAIPAVYAPYHPSPPSGMHSFKSVRFLVVRTDVEPLSVAALVRREILKIDRNQPVAGIRTTRQIVEGAIAGRRFNTLLSAGFAAIAMVLVASGIYGLMAYFVSQRVREIGIRMALGASRSAVVKLVLGRGLKLAAIGVAIGVAGVLASTGLITHMLYGVSPADPATVACGALCLVGVGVLGSLLPAGRATRVAAVTALRQE
jgi:putative ABC transport system permease protein